MHINLLLDWQLWLLLNFSLSGPVVDWGWGLGAQSIDVQKTRHAFARESHRHQHRQGLAPRWPGTGATSAAVRLSVLCPWPACRAHR